MRPARSHTSFMVVQHALDHLEVAWKPNPTQWVQFPGRESRSMLEELHGDSAGD
jgi:hypothetical protein